MAQDRDLYQSANDHSLEAGFLTADDNEQSKERIIAGSSKIKADCSSSNLFSVERHHRVPYRQDDSLPTTSGGGSFNTTSDYHAACYDAYNESGSGLPMTKEAMRCSEPDTARTNDGNVSSGRTRRGPLLRGSRAIDHVAVDGGGGGGGGTKDTCNAGLGVGGSAQTGVPSVIIDKLEVVNSETINQANNDSTCCEHGGDRFNMGELEFGLSEHQNKWGNNSGFGDNKSVQIRIEDCFPATQFLDCSSSSGGNKAVVISTTGIGTSLGADNLAYLESPAPPPSPTSDSAVAVGDYPMKHSYINMKPNRLSHDGYRMGSLSDNSLERSADKDAQLERRQMEDRLKNWKKTNKIITHIRENPFNMHMDCLDQLNKKPLDDCKVDYSFPDTTCHQSAASGAGRLEQQIPIQHQKLQSYATHLSHLYKKNQAIMDNNTDFRTLLYNIICCLLTQEEQILSAPSVTKMIDVIRAHLESASKFYSAATLSFNNSNNTQGQLLVNQSSSSINRFDINRKSSLGSLSLTSSSSSNFNATNTSTSTSSTTVTTTAVNNSSMAQSQSVADKDGGSVRLDMHQLNPNYSSERRPKPADFRRISSVSYNDEQLINDLCDGGGGGGQKLGGVGSNSVGDITSRMQESPWRYEELSSECKHNSQHNTSQSSLDHNTSTVDFMHDSGVGTIYDFQLDEFLLKNNIRGGNRKRHSDVTEFKPKQQPSYISTDDYMSQLQDDSNRTSYYDDESHSTLRQRDLHDNRPVDVVSRRAELEWTLNKLINFEVKYTWLTGNDTLRRAIRKIGVPNEIRGKVWLILMERMTGNEYETLKLLDKASKTIAQDGEGEDEEVQSILKQIDLDVNRTMPGHKLFDDGAEGGIKLRRILVAYSIHINRAIAYCQGFNFIVALLLSVFEGDEEKALRGFVCIVDHIFPSKYYFDHYLTGARADQFLLADFICDQLIKNPTTAERKMVEGVTSSITLNWFISLFHGAVPTLTRLTILDHFMLDGVKALFRFTMAILYLAFQVTPPSCCDVFTTIRNTAKDLYDIKLLLSIVEQIKLPKDSYFAIRRSFYMVQSSFNSDQFYMQSLSNDTSRQLVSNKPISVQNMPDTKPPAMSLIMGSALTSSYPFAGVNNFQNFTNNPGNRGFCGPRICTSADRTKVCIQNIGKLGRSHIKIMDTNVRSQERSLMSPLRNCLVIGISNCGKNIVVARQSSKRNFKTFREQDLLFNVHEFCAEIFDGFYLEECKLALISTHSGEIYKIDISKCYADSQVGSTETLTLRDSHSIGEHEKMKLRLTSIDTLTNLLWVYVECEDTSLSSTTNIKESKSNDHQDTASRLLYRNNPFMHDDDDSARFGVDHQSRFNQLRKILIIDILTFDIFSAFSLHQSFGDIMSMRTSLVAFCQSANPMSNQFSSRIVRIGPTGHYEHLLSFSDVVDFMISVPELSNSKVTSKQNVETSTASERYASIKRLLPRSISLNHENRFNAEMRTDVEKTESPGPSTLTKYYRSLMRRHSTTNDLLEKLEGSKVEDEHIEQVSIGIDEQRKEEDNPTDNLKSSTGHDNLGTANDQPCRDIISSYLGDLEDVAESNYTPVNMVFIFRNGKIALFEFTETYAIHTRESQLDRYDYSKVIDVTKNGEDFVVTILTIFDKLIKVVI